MKSIALAITLMLLLAVASLSLAFNVTVSVPGQDQAQNGHVYQTVEMQPMNEDGKQIAKSEDTDPADQDALVAEKE